MKLKFNTISNLKIKAMQKQINFKTIELEKYQVLLEKCLDDDDETEAIQIVFYIHDFKIVNKLLFETEEKQNKAFDLINSETAQGYINAALKILNE
ncbi:hypothetical protein B0A56_00560 [Flavobacterium columnare NBRC 100251 = ATCC 23463]|nr:hypothetical protein B0A56_00560 [Flavobacterium columnare NBRC 100251 = ATCC 23463]